MGLAMTACSEDEKYVPGDPDVEGCYGVYFPAQEAAGSHTYDPSQAAEVTFTVARSVSEGDITVPLEVSVSEEGIFEVGELKFEDGQTESSINVKFPNSKIGVVYSLAIAVKDPQYASIYKDATTAVEFSVLRVEWQDFLNPVTNKPAEFTFYEGWWGEVHTATVKFYDVDGVRTCLATCNEVSDASTPIGIWGDAVGTTFSFIWDTTTKTVNGYDAVDVPKQYIGFDYSDWTSKPEGQAAAPIYCYDWFHFLITDGGYAGAWPDWASFLTKNPGAYDQSYYDGNGGFYFNMRYFVPAAGGGWKPDVFDLVALADGFVRVDYSIAAEADLTEDGVVPVYFTLGADVAAVKYAAFEGALTPTQIENKAAAIIDGSEKSESLDIQEAAAGLSFETSGIYTLVAVSFDASGAAQESTSVQFTYVAAGDEENYAVAISCGVGSAAKYRDANTDTSIEVYAYGDDITAAKMVVVSAMDLASNPSGCVKKLLSSSYVKADVLEAINGDGYSAVAKGLSPGTEYYVLVYATNGFSETVVMSETGEFTTGDPLPVYQNFDYSSYDESLEPAGQEAFFKTWNLYAVNLRGSLGMREYIGQAVITDSAIPDEGPDDYGLYDQYVTISGLSGGAGEKYGFNDGVTFDFYGGYLYNADAATVDGSISVYTLAATDGSGYEATYVSYFIPVLDGYYAFVCTPKYYNAYNFFGLGYYHPDYRFVAAYSDYLLVDPEKDDNGLAPAPSARLNSSLEFRIDNAVIEAEKKAFAPAAAREIQTYGSFTQVESLRDVKSAAFTTHKVEKPGRNSEIKEFSKGNLQF